MNIKVRSRYKKEFLTDSTHIFILSAFAIAQPLYDLLSRYSDFFIARHSKPIDIVLLTLFLSILIPLFLVLIEIGLKLINDGIRKIAHLVLVGILIITIIFPILKKFDFLGELLIWVIVFIGGGIFIFGYVRLKQLKTFITFLLPAVLIFPILFLFFSPVTQIVFPEKHEISQKKQLNEIKTYTPIVMVTFDEIATPYLMNEDRQIDSIRYPNFASLADQAHWFRNATTVAHSTRWAIPAILSGLYPSLETPKSPSIVGHPNNLFTFLGDIYQLKVIESRTKLCPEDLNLINKYTNSKNLKERQTALFSDISVIYLHYLLPQSLSHKLPDISQDWGQFFRKKVELSKNKKKIKKILKGRSKLFKQFLDSISPSQDPTLFFIHILLPHEPLEYIPSGKTYGYYSNYGLTRGKWTKDEWPVLFEFQRYLLQLQYSDKVLGELLTKLKNTKLFDDSLIIVTADHGVSYRPGCYRRSLTEKNAGDIMPIPLFLKLPNQKKVVINDLNVESVDILPTIADVIGKQLPWPVDGHSVFSSSFPQRDNRTTLGRKKYTFTSSAFREMFTESLNHFLTLFSSEKSKRNGLYEIGPYNIIGKNVSQFRIAKKKSVKIDISEMLPFIENVDPDSDFIPCLIDGDIITNTPLHLAISVNGIIHGVSKTQRFKKGVSRFFAMVPEHIFKKGYNNLEIFIIRSRTSGKIVLEPTINF